MNLAKFDNQSFSRGASRGKEALWLLVKVLFFLPPWPIPSNFRVSLLKAFGAEVGTGIVIRSGVDISFPWRLTLGNSIWLGEGVRILSLAEVRIGSNVCISQEAFLCTGSHDAASESFDLVVAAIAVNSRSWIAARAFIGPGVEIGADSVVGASAVIMKSLPPGSFAIGNPAIIRRRKE